MPEFVHLHNHTEYSFLDGANRIKDMVNTAASQGSPAIAITDHGGLFGAMEFYFACKSAGIKPILGYEAYITPGDRKSKDNKRNHLILLAKNNKGWQNLMKLCSIGYLEGFYYKPRIDYNVLEHYSEGLIATSACIGGAIQRAFLENDEARAEEFTDRYLKIFGEGNFYLELQDHGMAEEKKANEHVIDLAKRKGVPLIVANDAHYLTQEDAKAHEVLLCMQTNGKMSDPNRFKFSSDQFYLKSPEEMAQLFPDMPELLSNTVEIANKCEVDPENGAQLPSIGIPEGGSSISSDEAEELKELARNAVRKTYEADPERMSREMVSLEEKLANRDLSESKHLADLAIEGAKNIYGDPYDTKVKERLEYELGVIIWMGFPGYYLIVMDFLLEADNMGIFRGVRGSAAGSLVGFCIGISNVCPLKFDLIFERFLNPERVSMPDVDADLADADREKVIDYCVEKYGRDAVSQIINFGRMMAKAAVKDVARVLEVPVSEAQRLSNLTTEKTIAKSIDANPELKEELERNPVYQQVFDFAQRLEGLVRQPGMHAAGVIIAPGDITGWSPLFKQAGDNSQVMTQFDMKYIEQTGMIKMDFLGLRTLSVLQNAVELVKKFHGVDIDIWKDIKDGDEKTYREIFHKGETVEIFQFESPGMRKYLKQLKPTTIEDLIAMTSLYRPGPMENIPSFINRKHGREKIEYPHPMLSDILDVTYGIIIYQEQVMRIAQKMGKFTLGQADVLRKAMGKKKADVMEKMKIEFLKGAEEQDIDVKQASDVWALMAEFAKYGFNKAHACVYAHVSYQAAWLKAHYPREYMAAVMTSRIGNKEKFLNAKNEAERIGIKVYPPDVNSSDVNCSISDGGIRMGLNVIANVGNASEAVVEARNGSSSFGTFFNFCKTVDIKRVNKKSLESLIYAGAMDTLPGTRAQMFSGIERAVDYANSFQKDIQSGQTSLFGGEESVIEMPEPELPDVPPWQYNDVLHKEKEVLNFYVSGHPLKRYEDEVRGFSTLRLNDSGFKAARDGESVIVAGTLTMVRRLTTKKGDPMAIMELEDFDGSVKLVSFNKTYTDYNQLYAPDTMVLVRGKVQKDSGGEEGDDKVEIILDKMMPLADTRDGLTKSVHIRIPTALADNGFLDEVHYTLSKYSGEANLVLHIVTANDNEYRVLSEKIKVSPSKEMFKELNEKLGPESVWLSQRAA